MVVRTLREPNGGLCAVPRLSHLVFRHDTVVLIIVMVVVTIATIVIFITIITVIIMTREIMTFIINTITVAIDIARFARFHLSH